jgi:hypothetical protein
MMNNKYLHEFSTGRCFWAGPAIAEIRERLPNLYKLFEYRLSLKYDALDAPFDFVRSMFNTKFPRRTAHRLTALIVDCFANIHFKLVEPLVQATQPRKSSRK